MVNLFLSRAKVIKSNNILEISVVIDNLFSAG